MTRPGRQQAIVVVDAFTAQPFRGNPAAVCVLDVRRDDAWLQAVAREMNLSETAFLLRRDDGFGLRWFTPTVEMPLCGHATLASAHALWDTGELATDAVARFHTLSGALQARREGDWIALDFPALTANGAALPSGVAAALGVEPIRTESNRICHLVEVESEDVVRGAAPDFRRLAASSRIGVTVTSRARSSEFDFVSRFFAPAQGVDEDPVTGGAHCCLGPYWAANLRKPEVIGYQASTRGGIVRVRVAGPELVPGRVNRLGQAVTVLRGEFV
jgi:PhzF family phenazine biosynthesis protein